MSYFALEPSLYIYFVVATPSAFLVHVKLPLLYRVLYDDALLR